MYEGSKASRLRQHLTLIMAIPGGRVSMSLGFACIFLLTKNMILGHLKISSGDISFEVICPFESLVVYVLIVELQVLNILDTSSLSDM